MASRVFTMATAVVLCVPVLFAGYQVQANAVSSFGISFHRVAILPANAPEGVAPLWLEQLVFEKLAGRKIATVASAQVRQALFELGVTAVSREMLPQLAAKLRVDAFVDAASRQSHPHAGKGVVQAWRL